PRLRATLVPDRCRFSSRVNIPPPCPIKKPSPPPAPPGRWLFFSFFPDKDTAAHRDGMLIQGLPAPLIRARQVTGFRTWVSNERAEHDPFHRARRHAAFVGIDPANRGL